VQNKAFCKSHEEMGEVQEIFSTVFVLGQLKREVQIPAMAKVQWSKATRLYLRSWFFFS